MDFILRKVKICDPNSPFHNTTKDVYIKKGVIESIGINLKLPAKTPEKIFKNTYVSPGWVDLTVKCGEPGHEYKEDFDSLCDAGARGGFTFLGCLPDTEPALDSKSDIEYVIKKTAQKICRSVPVAAVTKNCAGEQLTDMIDLSSGGAFAFSNGWSKVLNSGLTEKILFYLKSINSLLITFPDTPSLSEGGIMHQSKTSTALGLCGIPSVSEEMAVIKDLKLLEFTDSKLHFGAISTKEAVKQITEAKKKKLQVSASVPVFNLLFDDTVMEGYDSMFKVKPPFREVQDKKALKQALKKGIIECVTALHIPEDVDAKNRELDYAAYGMQGIETVLPALIMAFEGDITAGEIVKWLSVNPRNTASLPVPVIDEKQEAELTIFSLEKEWTYTQGNKFSKAINNPLFDKKLKGFVEGVITSRGSSWFEVS